MVPPVQQDLGTGGYARLTASTAQHNPHHPMFRGAAFVGLETGDSHFRHLIPCLRGFHGQAKQYGRGSTDMQGLTWTSRVASGVG